MARKTKIRIPTRVTANLTHVIKRAFSSWRIVLLLLSSVCLVATVGLNFQCSVFRGSTIGLFRSKIQNTETPAFVVWNGDVRGALWSRKIEPNDTAPEVVFGRKALVIWSNDFHVSPTRDITNFLTPFGVRIVEKNLAPNCRHTNSCEARKTLKVLTDKNGADQLSGKLIQQFYEAYINDSEMASVDGFVCFHSAPLCELYMPFNKSILVIASIRYDNDRRGKESKIRWNENLRKIASHPRNLVAANNLYDVKYIEYFTGIRPHWVPSYCGYVNEAYRPTKPGFLLWPVYNEMFDKILNVWYKEKRSALNCSSKGELIPLRNRYYSFKYSDLVAHQGIVYIPYQVSTMSLFEQYRMAIPLFFPTPDTLAKWHVDYNVLKDMTWESMVHYRRSRKSTIPPHPSSQHLPDPNDDYNETSVRYWIQFADFYQLPHIQYFESIEDLVDRLCSISSEQLTAISDAMKRYNRVHKRALTEKWKQILRKVADNSDNKPN